MILKKGSRKSQFIEFLVIKDQVIHKLKPSKKTETSKLILKEFLQTVRISGDLDRFSINSILYFRYFLKWNREKKYLDEEKIRNNQKGAFNTIQIWNSVTSESTTRSMEESKVKMEYYANYMTFLIYLMGITYSNFLTEKKFKNSVSKNSFFQVYNHL
jgi:hypothetical protein